MTKISLFLIIIFLVSVSVNGQDLSRYKYVRVPEKYGFQNTENEYQLNALTAFLFEKFGFTALYAEPAPIGIDPCDMLQADVVDESNLFRTKLKLVLEDCRGKVVLTSRTGVSKLKAFQASFHEALRNAFVSVDSLDHVYEPKVLTTGGIVRGELADKNGENEGVVAVASSVAEVKVTPIKQRQGKYFNGAVAYELKRTAVGFDLVNTDQQDKSFRLFKSGRGDHFLFTSSEICGSAYFNSDQDLVVEYFENNSGNMVMLIFRKD